MVKSEAPLTPMQHTPMSYIGQVIGIAVNAAVLYYIIKLEAEHCKCIRDWRHTFIKGVAMVSIGISVLLMTPVVGMMMLPVLMGLLTVMSLISVVNVYAFFTYVGDLNKTQCACAVTEMSQLNKGMLVLRWVYVVGIAFSVLGILTSVVLKFMLRGTNRTMSQREIEETLKALKAAKAKKN